MRTMLFVYGTLMSGGKFHYLLEPQKPLGTAHAIGFGLYDLGRFPAAVAEGCGKIYGEVFFVDAAALRCIDHLEGVHQGLFKRVTHQVCMKASGNWLDAEMYVFNQALPKTYSVLGVERTVKKIEDGVWHQPKFHLEF